MKQIMSFLADEGLKKRMMWACSIGKISRSALIREGLDMVTQHYLEDKGKELTMEEKIDTILRRIQSN